MPVLKRQLIGMQWNGHQGNKRHSKYDPTSVLHFQFLLAFIGAQCGLNA
jgi:hypothetical protein